MKKRFKLLINAIFILKNENGTVLVPAILILVLLTIVGVAATNISNTEIKTSFNEIVHQQNFYRAEGAITEAVDLFDGIANPKYSSPYWVETELNQITNNQINDNTFWISGHSGTIPQTSATLDDTNFVVVSKGIVSGTSLSMGSSKVHSYSVYGRSAPPNRGATIIEIGYLKAF